MKKISIQYHKTNFWELILWEFEEKVCMLDD